MLYFQQGVTQTSELVNISDFFNGHIATDLNSSNSMYYFMNKYILNYIFV